MGNSVWGFLVGFQTNWDLNIFVHTPGDEIWLTYTAFPLEIVNFILNVNNSNGRRASDMTISENEIVLLDKEKSPCKSYLEFEQVINI